MNQLRSPTPLSEPFGQSQGLDEPYWVHGRVIDGYITQALACGLSMEAVDEALAQCGLSNQRARIGGRRVDVLQLDAFIRTLSQRLDDELFCLRHYERLRVGHHGAIDSAAVTAPTLGVSFEMYPRYTPLISNYIRPIFEKDEDGVWFRWSYVLSHETQGIVACRAAMIFVQRMRDLYGTSLRPLRVCLMLPRPNDVEVFENVFSTQPEFGAPWYGVQFAHADAARENPVADPIAHAEAVAFGDRLVSEGKSLDEF